MKFYVRRASAHYRDLNPPLPGAVCVRPLDDDAFDFEALWTLEVSSLEELRGLTQVHGKIIVAKPDGENTPDLPRLTVYDDYLE